MSGVNSFLYILYVFCPDKTTKFFSVIRGNAKRVIGGVALCQGVQASTPLPPAQTGIRVKQPSVVSPPLKCGVKDTRAVKAKNIFHKEKN